jgi:hypothetical protein
MHFLFSSLLNENTKKVHSLGVSIDTMVCMYTTRSSDSYVLLQYPTPNVILKYGTIMSTKGMEPIPILAT